MLYKSAYLIVGFFISKTFLYLRMQKIYTYGFWILLLISALFAVIIVNKDAEIKIQDNRDNFLETQNLALQNQIDNLQEENDTLSKQAAKVEIRTKYLRGERDSIYVLVHDTFQNLDSCNFAVRRLQAVCQMDVQIIDFKDTIIAKKDKIIYNCELQKGKYSQMVDAKDEVNEHLQQELKSERIRKKGAIFLFTAMAVLNAYLIIKK